MAVLVTVGMANLVWMAVVALVFLAEKTWRHGVGLTRAAGSATMLLGAAILARPGMLTWLSGT